MPPLVDAICGVVLATAGRSARMSAGSRLTTAGLGGTAVAGAGSITTGAVATGAMVGDVAGIGAVTVDGAGPDAFMFGLAGFLPCSGAFGSQFLFRSASIA